MQNLVMWRNDYAAQGRIQSLLGLEPIHLWTVWIESSPIQRWVGGLLAPSHSWVNKSWKWCSQHSSAFHSTSMINISDKEVTWMQDFISFGVQTFYVNQNFLLLAFWKVWIVRLLCLYPKSLWYTYDHMCDSIELREEGKESTHISGYMDYIGLHAKEILTGFSSLCNINPEVWGIMPSVSQSPSAHLLCHT